MKCRYVIVNVNKESIDIKIERVNIFIMKLKKIFTSRSMFCLVNVLLRTKHETGLVQIIQNF